ncbi:MAG: hypothetical protein JRG92_11710 [Deltaproteobacteria bacterium]|jgi:hypothetical protein|nr:hypothetical protein [Deltaproteobacteria bacterium]MBW2384294.1 hypothetical protein [Deltaproteobacteria bacterium]MBW2696494.1 hypothetical protein [Deltaproteobacteria bacterium]
MLRSIVFVALISALMAPAIAHARDQQRNYTNRQQCRRMTKQIHHFEGTVLKLAKDRGNTLWFDATAQHIARLKDSRADACPEWAKQRTAYGRAKIQAEQVKQMMIMAGKMALKYFTGGWM